MRPMTNTPAGRRPYRPVRDTLGMPCPQLYITQYVRQDGTCDIHIRTDEHAATGRAYHHMEVLSVHLGHPWQTSPEDQADSLVDVMWQVEAWLIRWFGAQLNLFGDAPGGPPGPEA